MSSDVLRLKICGIQTMLSADEYRAKNQKVSDLAFKAADKLINGLKWNREEIRCLFLMTSTPDYLIPSTASLLQKRLEIGHECLVWDMNMGDRALPQSLKVADDMMHRIAPDCKGILIYSDIKQDQTKQKAVAIAIQCVESGEGVYCDIDMTDGIYTDLPELFSE